MKIYSISIVSDIDSWINNYIPDFINSQSSDLKISWVNNVNELRNGDMCFLIGCSQIMDEVTIKKNDINLVVHESNLPEGRGWSPLTWQIIEGKNKIPIKLLEVSEKVDSGQIFLESEIYLNGHELVNEIRNHQSHHTFKLISEFIENYPEILNNGTRQSGNKSYYSKRDKSDSELNIDLSLRKNFNLLRVVDNEKYPAFFYHLGKKYKIKIEKYI